MKGFILADVVGFLESEFGDKVTQGPNGTLPDGPLNAIYFSMEDYPDNSLDDLLAHAATILSMNKSTLAKIVGVYMFSELMVINQVWSSQSSTYELLKSHDAALNSILEVSILGFIPPSFSCTKFDCDVLEVNYRSTFLPWDVAEGLIDAMSIYCHEHFSIERTHTEPQVGFNKKFTLRRKKERFIKAD